MLEKNKIKIGIIGLGPVGMILAVKLQEAGCDVSLCIRNEVKFQKIKSEGIFLQNVIKTNALFDNVYQNISDLANLDLDYLIFSVKSYQMNAVLEQALKLNSDKLTVIAAQNGIDVEEYLVNAFGENKTLRMVVNFAGNTISPNTVKVTFFTPPNYIGSVNDSKNYESELIANLLTDVNLKTNNVNSFELIKRVWEKTILNSSLSALCGVGRLTMAEAMNDPDTVELIEQIINEAVVVAEREKIKFNDDFIRQCMRYLKKGGDHFPSLALDIINNRQTEIDYFNSKIVTYGRKHYIRTSLNLSFTNMVKAMTNKNIISRVPGANNDLSKKILSKGIVSGTNNNALNNKTECFLGIDLGSAYAKFTVIQNNGVPVFRYFLPVISNDKQAFKNVLSVISTSFNIVYSCATGYGRKHFSDTDIIKTEINCAAAAVSELHSGEKNIIDIGGEDIKIIKCAKDNCVESFYMNDKCAAGTGSFLSEIAERANINISEMSSMASLSNYKEELNSFCTVFAKTEIMNWIFDGMSLEDISRGIYISIANRVAKMRIDSDKPIYMIGGVIAHHPYLKTILEEILKKEIQITDTPQFMVSYGAAIIAKNTYIKNNSTVTPNQVTKNINN